MVNVLFVCLGNICRSPIAEGTFREIVKQRGLQAYFSADSAGVMGWHTGDSPDKRTMANAEKHGLKLTHKGRKVNEKDLTAFQHIVAMDEENFEALHTLYYETLQKVPTPDALFLLRDYDPQRNDQASVPDPYYESEVAFEEVFQIVWRCNNALIDHLMAKYKIVIEEEK